MPEIEITEDQYEYLQALQDDIQTQVVGKYAHVRMVDAVQYLIDNNEGEINATVTEPTDAPATTESVPAADATGTGGVERSDGPSDDPAAAGVEAADGGSGGVDATPQAESGDDASPDTQRAPGEGRTDGDAAGGGPAAPMAAAGGDDDGMLSAMMALMDTHDDKWEAVAGDTGYEVELPDGSTETANTQDDVRALLFKHYE